MNNTEIIDYWHNGTFRDKERARMIKGDPLLYDAIIETKTFETTTGKSIIINPGKNAMANIRINGDYCKVRMETIGSTDSGANNIIATIHKATGANTFYFTDDGKCIPFPLELVFEIDKTTNIKTNLTVTVDIVSYTLTKEEYKFLLKRQQYYEHDIKSEKPYVFVYLGSITENILCKFEKPVSDVKLQLNNDVTKELNMQKIDDYTWELNFGEKLINLSRIDYAKLLCNTDDNKVAIISTSYNVGCILYSDFYRIVGVLYHDS